MMNPAYPQWPGFRLPFGRPPEPEPAVVPPIPVPVEDEVPDHHSQLEEILGHIRRCERWARLDDQIDLAWKLAKPE